MAHIRNAELVSHSFHTQLELRVGNFDLRCNIGQTYCERRVSGHRPSNMTTQTVSPVLPNVPAVSAKLARFVNVLINLR